MRGQLLFLATWLCYLLNSYEGFIRFQHIPRLPTKCGVLDRFTTDFEKLSEICQTIAVPFNTTATLINLIQYGDNWVNERNHDSLGVFERFKKGDKVPGCMADVHITTSFNYADKNTGQISTDSTIPIGPTVSIDGTADSRVAQGILALLCQVD